MTQVIDIRHWLDDDGLPARPVRKQALRAARLVEYGGPLELGHSRATLVECTQRVSRRACEGLLWVCKADARTIEAACPTCRREHLRITGWETTAWATGPMAPVRIDPTGHH
jgi:hypothetical protein